MVVAIYHSIGSIGPESYESCRFSLKPILMVGITLQCGNPNRAGGFSASFLTQKCGRPFYSGMLLTGSGGLCETIPFGSAQWTGDVRPPKGRRPLARGHCRARFRGIQGNGHVQRSA